MPVGFTQIFKKGHFKVVLKMLCTRDKTKMKRFRKFQSKGIDKREQNGTEENRDCDPYVKRSSGFWLTSTDYDKAQR